MCGTIFSKERVVPGCISCLILLQLALTVPAMAAESVMIIAAHPDDEALMAAGVMKQALIRNDYLKVVLVTNGDAHSLERGYVRQQESLAGLSIIGINRDDVIFLGYPNYRTGGLLRIYNNHLYESSTPYTSPSTGRSSTYGAAGLGHADFHTYVYGTPAAYTKAHLLKDLEFVLNRYRPTQVYTHSPADEHPEHRITFYAVKSAMQSVISQNAGHFRPRLFTTIVHSPKNYPYTDSWPASEFRLIPEPDFSNDSSWPEPVFSGTPGKWSDMIKRFTPETPLTAPPNLPYDWSQRISLEVPLSMQTSNLNNNLKFRVINEHKSQYSGSGFIFAFGKKDEIFWDSDLTLPPEPVNLQPYFTRGPSATSYEIAPSSSVQLSVNAVDPEHRSLTYSWSATHGTISGAGPNVTYLAPPTSGIQDMIRSTISDGVNAPLNAHFTIRVEGGAPPVNEFQLWLSPGPDRSGAVLLDGSTGKGNLYIFVQPEYNIARVSFTLDGVLVQTENLGPFDFAGTATDGTAMAFDSNTVSAGLHTVRADIIHSDGATQSTSASFSIINDTPLDDYLYVSLKKERTNATPLSGAILAGRVYIFVSTDKPLQKVIFYVDGSPGTSQPWQVESFAPYDFNGTAADGSAMAFDVSKLSGSAHSITAQYEFSDGTISSETASFEVEDSSVPTPLGLFVSQQNNRGNPVPLNGIAVQDLAYIFVSPETGISRVDFYLDDEQMTRPPIQIENLAPFDFAGTAAGNTANPFSTAILTDGSHTITAAITPKSGPMEIETISFTVQNEPVAEPVSASAASDNETDATEIRGQAWELSLFLEASSHVVTMGQNFQATDGIDIYDELASATDVENSSILIQNNETGLWLTTDIQKAGTSRTSWLIFVDPAQTGDSGRLQWEFSAKHTQGIFQVGLADEAGSVFPATIIDMKEYSEMNLPAESTPLFLKIVHTTKGLIEERRRVRSGWNLISFTLIPDQQSVERILSNPDVDEILRFDSRTQNYVLADNLDPFIGYWLYALKQTDLWISGQPASDAEVILHPGLNLYGPAIDIPVPSSLNGYVRGWDSEKQVELENVSHLEKGSAYWFQVDAATAIILQ